MIYLIFFLSIVIHEFGHIVTCKLLHRQFGAIKLGVLGFSNTELKLSKLNIFQKILILISGSFFNLIFAIICLNISSEYGLVLCYSNTLIGIFNLLPIIPLDGGNILICILNRKYEINKSIEISLIVSKIFLVCISFIYCISVIILKNVFILLLIVYLWYLYLREEREFRIYFQIENNLKILNKI